MLLQGHVGYTRGISHLGGVLEVGCIQVQQRKVASFQASCQPAGQDDSPVGHHRSFPRRQFQCLPAQAVTGIFFVTCTGHTIIWV